MADRSEPSEDKRRQFEESIADVLEGSAPAELLDLAEHDDWGRDFVYEAQRTVEVAQAAAADHVYDADGFEHRVLSALDEEAAPTSSSGASEAPGDPELVAEEELPRESSDAAREPFPRRLESADPEGEDDTGAPRTLGQRLGARGRFWVAMCGLAVAAAAAWVALHPAGTPAVGPAAVWDGRVAQVSSTSAGSVGLERCSPDRALCRSVTEGSSLPAGSRLKTDGRTRALIEFQDGSHVVMDRDTEVLLDADSPRRLVLAHGGLVAEVAPVDGANAVIEVPLGFVEVLGTKFALRAFEDLVRLDVSRGSVRLVDKLERSVVVHAGESGELRPNEPPTASAIAALEDSLGWSEHAFGEEEDEGLAAPGLGELRAKKPGEESERKDAVHLTRHAVKVRIVGNVARTEIEEVFSNQTDDVLEGIYRFPMPPDARIERLALDVDGKLEEGAFVDREKAAKIWRGAIVNATGKKPSPREEIVWVPGPWKDPALLEWQRGGRFELRVYPIPKRGSRRIVIAYTQTIAPSGDTRRYVYPLPHDPGGTTRVGQFSVDVELRGHDEAFGTRPIGYSFEERDAPAGTSRFVLSANDFVPAGDLAIEYALPSRHQALTAWTYQPDGSGSSGGFSEGGYVAFALRPKLPRTADDAQRSFAIVVDASRSMIGERYRRASRLAARVVREMDRDDLVTVLACDTQCREAPGGAQSPGPRAAAEFLAFLEGLVPEGGSDLTEAIRAAHRSLPAASGHQRVVYIGDGTPTVGAIDPAFIRREVEEIVSRASVTVTAVPLGADADHAALEAIASAGAGVVLPYAPGQRTADVAYAVLGATYGSTLHGATVELPPGLEEVLPRRLPTFVAGGETVIVAKMTEPEVTGAVRLAGQVGSTAFEAKYPVALTLSKAKGNAFVPRLFAAAKIAELEKSSDAESRDEAVALSQRFQVASRYTSLLVLESPAMFRAFGLDNTRTAELWTGEEESVASASEREPADDFDEWQNEVLEGFDSARGTGAAPAPAPRAVVRSKASTKMKKRSAPRSMADELELGSGFGGVGRRADVPAESSGPLAPPARDRFAPPPPAATVPAPEPMPLPERRRWVPMRKVWDRVGSVVATSQEPKDATEDAIRRAERAAAGDVREREAMKRLYTLYMRAGDLDGAGRTAERWSEKDPLDPDALTARADVAAARGDRELAIRILGSVVDVRPGDHKAQWRLARLHRWAGRPKVGCRNSMAVAQFRRTDAKLLVEAVRCVRGAGLEALEHRLLEAADDKTRNEARNLLEQRPDDPGALKGDLRLLATWDAPEDLDLAMIHPEGHRVSWLGAPTRSIITARDVLSTRTEALALNGALPGDYVLEISRATPGTRLVKGTVRITAGKTTESIPFELSGQRARFGIAKITMRSRLVPL